MTVSVTNREVMDVILDNNAARMTEILEAFDLTNDGTPPHFSSANRPIASIMLSFASAMSFRNNLDSDLAKELIERTAMTVDIFVFAQLVVTVAGFETDNFDIIPEKIRTALKKNDYADGIACAIEELDNDAFVALLAFLLTKDVERTNVKFNLPIMRYIYANETISEGLLFAYMGLSLRDADEKPSDLRSALGVLGGLALLDALTN